MSERRPEQTLPVPDAEARRLAETTFDRNVVVIAGAGTGKTTLLVNRILNVLLREPAPVPITQLVALTFTNKAAAEMKIRLRERLQALLAPEAAHNRVSGAVSAEDLRERYGLTTDRIVERAAAALHDLEKAQIGTLHSFAAHLLRCAASDFCAVILPRRQLLPQRRRQLRQVGVLPAHDKVRRSRGIARWQP